MKTLEKGENRANQSIFPEYTLCNNDKSTLVRYAVCDSVPCHRTTPCFVCANHGSLTITAGEKDYVITEGDVLFLPTGDHTDSTIAKQSSASVSLVEFSPALAGNPDKLPTEPVVLKSSGHESLFTPAYIIGCIKAELKLKKIGCTEAIRSYISIVLVSAVRELTPESRQGDGIPSNVVKADIWLGLDNADTKSRAPAHSSAMHMITEEIKNSITSEISIDKLASDAHMSRSNFFRVFKRHTGMSVNEYIVKARVEKVLDILTSSESNILDAAYASGFTSSSGFYKTFKKITGLTPSEYLKTTK